MEIIEQQQVEKSVLVIAYHAPPSNASGTFRTLGFVRHLSDLGWQVTLLTVTHPDMKKQGNDLLEKIPSTVRIIRAPHLDVFSLWAKFRVGRTSIFQKQSVESHSAQGSELLPLTGWWQSFKEVLTTFLKTPDQQTGWLLTALVKCCACTRKPDIIYSSAPPFTGHLIGVLCKIWWRRPLVCDFRDPWRDNPFRNKIPAMVEAWDGWLERLVFVRADLLIANTSKISELFKSRGTSIAQKTITIPNGFDPEDFADIEALRTYPDDKCLLVHAGVLYGPRNPINFLLAVQELARNNICPHLQILFVGPSMPIGGETLKKVIIGMGLSTYIQTNPSVPHARALSLMKGADALLLLALGTRLQVPAKLFEYFALRKPICSITESDSATVEMTARMGGAIYSAENTPREIRKVLEVLYSDWERGQFANRSNNFVHDDSMHRIVQTQALEGHFISLMKNRL